MHEMPLLIGNTYIVRPSSRIGSDKSRGRVAKITPLPYSQKHNYEECNGRARYGNGSYGMLVPERNGVHRWHRNRASYVIRTGCPSSACRSCSCDECRGLGNTRTVISVMLDTKRVLEVFTIFISTAAAVRPNRVDTFLVRWTKCTTLLRMIAFINIYKLRRG